MNDAPIGILLAAYNAEATLDVALESLLSQTKGSWVATLVDDGSQDSTSNVMQHYAQRDARFIVVRQNNQGTARARNAAEKLLPATVQQLAYLDADDYLEQEYVEVISEAWRQFAPLDLLFTNAFRVDYDGGKRPWVEGRATGALSFEHLLRRSEFLGGGALFSRERFRAVGGFSDSYVEDYDLWLRMMATGARAYYIDRALYCYNVAREGRKTTDRERNAQETISALDRILKTACLNQAEQEALQDHKQGCLLRPALDAQRDRVRLWLEHRVGATKTAKVMRAMHTLARPFRPLRKLWAQSRKGSHV